MPTQTEPATTTEPAGAQTLLDRWQAAYSDTARRNVPEAFDPATGQPIRELTAEEDTECILAANAEVSPEDLQPVTTCQHQYEVWGPHEGCREFMTHPETFPCGQPVTTVIVIHDHFHEAMSGEDGRSNHWLCGEYASECRAAVDLGYETILSVTPVEVAA